MFNIEIERSVLACLISGKNEQIVKLNENDFCDSTNILIFKVVKYLLDNNKHIDVITVSDLLSKRKGNSLEIINGIVGSLASPENITHYIKILKDYTIRREFNKIALEIIEKCKDINIDSIEFKNDILQKFNIDVYGRTKSNYGVKDIILSLYETIEKRKNDKDFKRLYTGFYKYDKLTVGLHPGEMTIIAGIPGTGKTAMTIQLFINMAKNKNKCILFSREMSKEQLTERILSNISGIDSQLMRTAKNLTEKDWIELNKASNEIFNLPITINDEAFDTQQIRAACRELKNKNELGIVAIDYLQRCKTTKKTATREREVAEMSWDFKQLACEFKIPVIVLSQFSRESQKQKREPVMSDLRDSGAIEQDADNIVFLHVPEDTDTTQNIFDIKVILSKQRNGPTGFFHLRYCRKTFRFWNVK